MSIRDWDTEESDDKWAAPKRILIVDDLKDGADSMKRLLEMIGHEVYTLYNGEEAIEQVGTIKPDVLLLDIGMPKRSGYDVCCYIRGQPWGKDMLIIAITGWGQAVDRRRTKQAGFDHHLVKPIDIEVLKSLINAQFIKRDTNDGVSF
ncbi:MAG: response regulator [Chthoniobacterales bacterium]